MNNLSLYFFLAHFIFSISLPLKFFHWWLGFVVVKKEMKEIRLEFFL